MPIYQYRCESCGVSFERTQRFSEDPLKNCPECSGKVHRVIQPVGIIFKGSGFYVTDNRANSALLPGKRSDAADSTSSPAEKSDSSTPAETKPAAPEPPKASAD
jgi:putative FmdB family regulatory protein